MNLAPSRARGPILRHNLKTTCALPEAGAVMATKNEAPEDENEEAEGEESGQPALARRFSLKLILMAVGGVVAVAAVGGGGYFFFTHHGNAAVAATQVKPPVFLDMPDILVNLSSTGGSDRTQYLKVKI